jgi:hypothetical protein
MFLLEIVKAMTKAQVPHAVAGGYAVAMHGAIRGTVDVDLVISLKAEHLKAAQLALESIGLSSRLPITAEEVFKFRREYIEKRNLMAWSFVDFKDPTRIVDLLLIHDVSKLRLVQKRVGGVDVSLLSIPSLIKIKKQAGRPQDLEDVKALEKIK